MIDLWLIRHGQTEDNISQTLAGHLPGKLTDLGIKQADLTGKFLKNEAFDFAYVSDLGRTRETFDTISKQMNTKSIKQVLYSQLMREKGGGVFEGKSLQYFRQQAEEKKIPIREFKGQNGECWNDVLARAKQFLTMIIENHLKDKNEKTKIIGISHGGFIMEVYNCIAQIQENKEPVLNNNATNCSIHKIQILLNSNAEKDVQMKNVAFKIVERNNNSHLFQQKQVQTVRSKTNNKSSNLNQKNNTLLKQKKLNEVQKICKNVVKK